MRPASIASRMPATHALGIERLEASPGGSRRSSFGRRDHRRGDGSRLAGCSGVRGGAASQRRLMRRNRLGQLLYQKAQFADFRRDRIDRGVRTIDRALQLALGGGEAVLELGHLLGEVGGQHATGRRSDRRRHCGRAGGSRRCCKAQARSARPNLPWPIPRRSNRRRDKERRHRARNEHHADSDKDGGKPEHAIPEVQIQLCQKSDFRAS